MPSTLHGLFSAQAAATPGRVAVVEGARSLTYGELEAQSNRLAHRLRAMGVGPEVFVAICFERSIELLVGILGILKAGGAYVPLDPANPAERRRYMLADTGARTIVSQSRFRDALAGFDGELVLLDDPGALSGEPSAPLPETSGASNLAYVIYTSGSTGDPKGVLVEHGNVMSSLRGLRERFPAGKDDGWLFKSNHTFDASLLEMFGPMWHGGRVVIVPAGGERDPLTIARTVEAYGATHAFFVPSSMQALLDVCGAEDVARLRSLKYLLVGGEAMTRRFAERLRALPLAARIANVYGPTETAIICTACMLDEAEEAATTPIGTMLGTLTAHVLDEQRQPVPPGTVGELYIGGASVARGYLHAPDLTAARFLESWLDPSERLYKTGDLCRVVARGQIEFIGRVDRQVKIRGYRVELGEIEVALAAHPGVRDAVVTASGIQGDLRLTAYVVPAAGAALETRELRAFLRQSLPDHMIPAAWMQLAALPLNENGKVDRAALPPVAEGDAEAPEDVPAGTTADVIARVCAEELGITEIGPHEDFFALGGHSLAAARVVTRLRALLHREIAVSDLYRAPTVRGLEQVLATAAESRREQARADSGIVSRGPIPLTYEQLGFWLYERAGVPNLNVFGRRRVRGSLDRHLLTGALARVIDDHPVLRCHVNARVPVQVVQHHLPVEMVERDLRSLPEAEKEQAVMASIDELAAFTAWRPEAPLVLLRLLRLQDDVSELQVCMPHVVSDEASVQVLFEDLSAHYLAPASGTKAAGRRGTFELAAFVRNERTVLEGSLRRHGEFWERYLADGSTMTFPESEVLPPSQRSESVYVELPAAALDALRGTHTQQGLAFSELVYAAALSAVAPFVDASPGGGRQAVLFVPKSTRESADSVHAIGLFARIDCLKVEVGDEPDVAELALRVRQAAMETQPHQICPTAIKSAGLQKRRWQAWPVRDLMSRVIARSVTTLFRRAELDYEVVLAHLRLASLQKAPARDFALIVNILNSFMADGEDTLFGCPLAPVQVQPTYEPPIRRLIEFYFMRDPHLGNAPLLMINGDLAASFRRQLGAAVVAALESCARTVAFLDLSLRT